jgi:hypothetical protein
MGRDESNVARVPNQDEERQDPRRAPRAAAGVPASQLEKQQALQKKMQELRASPK